MTSDLFDPDYIAELRKMIEDAKAELASGPAELGLVPLRLECSMTSCTHGRHCLDYLRRPHPGETNTDPGKCRDCGQTVTDFSGVTSLPGTVQTEAVLRKVCAEQHELIRAHYWRVPIDMKAYNQARRLGMTELRGRMAARVRATLVAPDAFSGRGASYSHQILAYAQHATATCCRRCAAYWHGMPSDDSVAPPESQIEHAIALAQVYLTIRLPDLSAEPESVASIRSISLPGAARRAELDENTLQRFGRGEDPAGLMVPEPTSLRVQKQRRGLILARVLEFQTAS